MLEKIKESIRATEADIVLLQEVVGENSKLKKKHNGWPKESQFEFLADTVWPHFAYGKNAVFPHTHHGNAILSKFPILFYENINLSTNKLEQRGLLHTTIELPAASKSKKRLDVFNVHLNLLEGSRWHQSKKILNRCLSHVPHDAAFILGGDFNDWRGVLSGHFQEHAQLNECFLLAKGNHAKTFPSLMPLIGLDRLYFKNLDLLSCEEFRGQPWTQNSDHLPILGSFEIDLN